MASPAVQLASSCALPAAVSHSYDVHNYAQSGGDVPGRKLQQGNSSVQLAPYQALPVAGPVITHNKATALDVQELSPELNEEVSLPAGEAGAEVRGTGETAAAAVSLLLRQLTHVCLVATCVLQDRLAAVNEILQKYMKKLKERTTHHMG